MRNLKYVAFLMSVGLLGFSPAVVHADDTNVAIAQEDTGQIAEPSADTGQADITKPVEVPKDTGRVAEPSTDISTNSGVATDSAIEISVPSNITYEKKEIQLDSIPSDLHVDLPTNITLEALNDNQYGYTGKIKISCDSDNEYRVELSLKDTGIKYVSPEGNTVSGVATIGDSTSYSWSYEDVASDLEIPLFVVVDKPEYTGNYTTALNFSIDVYQMQEVEVKTEENASDTKDTEKLEDVNGDEAMTPKKDTATEETPKEDTGAKEDINTDTSKDDSNGEVSKDDTDVVDTPKDNTEAQPSASEENTVVADDSTSSGVAFENTDTLFISKDITSIASDAFDSLDLLKVINYEGTEEEWNKIFTGSLKSGVVLNFNSSMTDDSTVAPTESTSSKVEDSQLSTDCNSSRDLTIEDSQPITEVESVDYKSSQDSFEITESADSVTVDTESADSVSSSIDE